MGEKAVRAALGELEEAGYRHRFTVRREGGRIRTVTVFSDVSMGRAEALSELPEEQRVGVVDPEEPRQSCGSRIRRSHRAALHRGTVERGTIPTGYQTFFLTTFGRRVF